MMTALPTYRSLLLSVTEACSLGCAHCGLQGSGRGGEADAEELVDRVGQAARCGIPAVIFTGGEPFERFDTLRRGVVAARANGVRAACFSNGFWARTPGEALRWLRPLAGLHQLYLSSDVYHQARLPFARVHHAIEAARSVGVAEITICITYARESERRLVRAQYAGYEGKIRFYEEPVIPVPGGGLDAHRAGEVRRAWNQETGSACWLDTPLVTPDGEVFACHAGKVAAHGRMRELPYWLGCMREDQLHSVLARARLRPDYQYLRTRGPRGVARIIERDPGLWRSLGHGGFSSACHLCFSTLSTDAGRARLREVSGRAGELAYTDAYLALVRGEAPIRVELAARRGGNGGAAREYGHV